MITAKDLKHTGLVKKASSYTETGQPSGWQTEFTAYFGIDTESVSDQDEQSNTGNKKTLSLFTRYDVRLQNGQALFIFGQLYKISQLDNVQFANRRLNFTATEL